jgi:NADH-quinone oxidoreductase subunit G
MTETKMIKAKINDILVEVPAGTTILDAARKIQVNIPTLCKHPDLHATAGCGICIVKVKGSNKLLRSCCTDISEGMEVTTHDSEIIQIRKTVLELILSNHPDDCLHCGRNTNCELQNLAAHFVIRGIPFHTYTNSCQRIFQPAISFLSPTNVSSAAGAWMCARTYRMSGRLTLSGAAYPQESPAGDILLADSPCVRCGQCSAHCPTGAIVEYDNTYDVCMNFMTRKNTVLSRCPGCKGGNRRGIWL